MAYANRTCKICGLRRPVTEMKEVEITEKSGSSSGSFSLSTGARNKSQRIGYNTGRTYYRNKRIWVCAEDEAHHDPSYFKRKEKERAAIGMLKAIEKSDLSQYRKKFINEEARSLAKDSLNENKYRKNIEKTLNKINKKYSTGIEIEDLIDESLNYVFSSKSLIETTVFEKSNVSKINSKNFNEYIEELKYLFFGLLFITCVMAFFFTEFFYIYIPLMLYFIYRLIRKPYIYRVTNKLIDLVDNNIIKVRNRIAYNMWLDSLDQSNRDTYLDWHKDMNSLKNTIASTDAPEDYVELYKTIYAWYEIPK